MCYICSCFGWILDFIQRVITFGLTCILCFAICFGLSIAIIAGIAYGYNYSMAEFLTFTRSDVTVFMKRGQFAENGASSMRRRSGGDDMFSANASMDYEEAKPLVRESKPLADTWMKSQDTRKYAEILTKYNPGRIPDNQPQMEQMEQRNVPRDMQPMVQQRDFHGPRTPPDSPIISIVPNPLMPTVSWRSGSSKIMMRNFKPLQDFTSANKHTERPESLFPTRGTKPQAISILGPKERVPGAGGGTGGKNNDFHKSFVPMRMWGTTARAVIPDEPEDVDEDNVVYRPV